MITRVLGTLVCLSCLVILGGCATKLMPTPVAFGEGGADPFSDVTPEESDNTIEIFLVTDRAKGSRASPGDSQNWGDFYSNNRDDKVHAARATVRIGKEDTDWEQIRKAALTHDRKWDPPLELVSIEEFGTLWTMHMREGAELVRSRKTGAEEFRAGRRPEMAAVGDTFREELDAQLARSKRKDIYIFVHGFNTSLENNTLLAASLFNYLGRDGVMMSYEWPSRHSAFKYEVDKAAARVSVLRLRLVLWALQHRSDAERIHIIGHSAGSPLVVSALTDLRLMQFDATPAELARTSKIGQVVLAAPDMDVIRFANSLYDGFDQTAKQVTLYTSSRDEALGLSKWIMGFSRLGSPAKFLDAGDMEKLRGSDTMTVIDAAEAIRQHDSFVGHSYFHANPWVSSDLMVLLKTGAPPEERGLYREPDGGMWLFPKDYLTIAPERARQLYGQE